MNTGKTSHGFVAVVVREGLKIVNLTTSVRWKMDRVYRARTEEEMDAEKVSTSRDVDARVDCI